jgi:hypothetical protein
MEPKTSFVVVVVVVVAVAKVRLTSFAACIGV